MSGRASKLKSISLHEQVVRSAHIEKVDREKGIIYGVKVLGWESLNGRRYLPEAAQAAMTLYEGCPVNLDHPAKAETTRPFSARFGWLEQISYKQDGLYGNLHVLNPLSEDAITLFNAAEKKPNLFGLSHNAEGEGDSVEGVWIVRKITEVRSVDLVTEPATTNGLYEGKAMKIKRSAFLETLSKKFKGSDRAIIKKLIEDAIPGMDDDMPEQDTADHKTDLLNAVGKLIDSEDPEDQKIVDGIMKLLKPRPASDVEEDEDNSDAAFGTERGDEKPAKAKVESFCRLAGIKADAALLEGLVSMGKEDAILKHLEWLKTNLKSAAPGVKPKSQAPGTDLQESRNGKPLQFADNKARVAFLRGGVR